MKWIVELIKKNYTILLIASIFILLLIDIGTRFWFWKGLHLEYDAINFNNIVTPIGTIITALLFFILTVRQLEMLRRQNQVIESQNIKPHFEKEFERVRELLERKLPKQPLVGYYNSYKMADMNSLNCIEYISSALRILTDNEEYKEDLDRYLKGEIKTVDFYINRSYHNELSFLIYYSHFGIQPFAEVEYLVKRIIESKILEEDKEYFKRRIVDEFIENYLKFIKRLDLEYHFAIIPDDFFGVPNISVIQFSKSGFRKHYDNFYSIGKSYAKK